MALAFDRMATAAREEAGLALGNLGPAGAYARLAASAWRFGFVPADSWKPRHQEVP